MEQVLESILSDSDEEDLEDVDDPDEPMMEGSDDDFQDLYDDLNEEIDEGRDVHSFIQCKLVLTAGSLL